MKCPIHQQETDGVCAHCGRAVCGACARVTASQRTACSEACAQALAKTDRAIDAILTRGTQAAKASAFVFIASGLLLIGFGIYTYWRYPQLRLAHLLCGIMGIAFVVFGVRYHSGAKKGDL